jgi:hypothetical protein
MSLHVYLIFASSNHDEWTSCSVAVDQLIIVKFLTNENCEICWDSDETQSTIRWWNTLKDPDVWVCHLKKDEQRLKQCEDHTFCRVSYGLGFWGPQGVLFIDFLKELRTINEAYYSKLLRDRIKPNFRSKRRSLSVKSVSPPRQSEFAHSCCNKRKTGEIALRGAVTPRI